MALESCIARGAHIHVLLPVMVCVQIDVESLPTVVSGALEKPEATPRNVHKISALEKYELFDTGLVDQ